MYKIMLVARKGSTGEEDLWKYLWVDQTTGEGDSAVTTRVEYSTESATDVQDKYEELLETNPSDRIRVVEDKTVDIAITVS